MNRMNIRKSLLVTAMLAAAGGTVAVEPAFAGPVAAGSYNLVILTTPVYTNAKGKTSFAFGSDGAWNSSLTFGGSVPNPTSQAMTDNGVNLTDADGAGTASRAFGSSIGGDGYAGILGITIASGTGAVTVTSLANDAIFGTPAGTFAFEGGDLSAYSGGVNLATGTMTLVTGDFASGAGRRAGIDAGEPGFPCGGSAAHTAFCDQMWQKDDIGPIQEYATFRTGSASTDTATINGAILTSIGDVNADGLTDYKAVLVRGNDFGTAWQGFAGTDYFEVWSVQLLSTAVPLPAAVWLFGSGLLGLAGAARRHRTSGTGDAGR